MAQSGSVGMALAKAGETLSQTPEGASCLLALALLHERSLGERSRLAPYVSILPTADELQHPLLWSPSYVDKLLQGSHLVERLQRLRADLIDEFAGLHADVFSRDPATFPPDAFTADLYVWAHAITLSRALPVGGAGDGADGADGGELALVPLLDLANHDESAPHTWEASQQSGAVSLVAGRRVQAGEELCLNYGRGVPRATWEFFYSYGCVPTVAGLDDEAAAAHWLEAGGRPLHLTALQPDDALLSQKLALLVALGADESVESGVESHVRPSAPADAAPLLRLGHLSARNCPEVAVALEGWAADPTEVWGQLQRPLNAELETAVATQMLEATEAALAPLPPSIPLAMAAARDDATTEEQQRERAAARVLLGERHALEACRDYWKSMEEALQQA